MVKRRRGNVSLMATARAAKADRTPSVVDDVSVARDRLKGALQCLLDPSESSGHYDSTNKHGHKRKQDEFLTHFKQEQITARQEERKAAIAARRRQRRAEMSHVPYHNSFVMKLFDRSVDLAQFKEETPLYPICRAWMANQPRQIQIKEIKRSSSPEPKPKPEPIDDDDRMANGFGEGSDLDGLSDADLVKDTHSLPTPAPLSFVKYPICKPEQASNLDIILSGADFLTREDLLREHIDKWCDVRSDWIKAANENEDRFKPSRRILRAIYEKAQKAFE